MIATQFSKVQTFAVAKTNVSARKQVTVSAGAYDAELIATAVRYDCFDWLMRARIARLVR